jgi:hypothetical protein
MRPEISGDSFVFCTTKADIGQIIELDPWAIIKEEEGYTFILTKNSAEKNSITYEEIYKRITLNVHSSLDAVGLTAVVSTELAKSNISANVVAGYYHDHIFIQAEKAEIALRILKQLGREES